MPHLDSPAHLVLDLSAILFIGSAGLGALVSVVRRTRELGGEVAVCCNLASVMRLLHNTGLDEIVTITATRRDAHASFGSTGEDRADAAISMDRIDD